MIIFHALFVSLERVLLQRELRVKKPMIPVNPFIESSSNQQIPVYNSYLSLLLGVQQQY